MSIYGVAAQSSVCFACSQYIAFSGVPLGEASLVSQGPTHARLYSVAAQGYYLRALKLKNVERELAEEHYVDLKSKPFYPGLVEYIVRRAPSQQTPGLSTDIKCFHFGSVVCIKTYASDKQHQPSSRGFSSYSFLLQTVSPQTFWSWSTSSC